MILTRTETNLLTSALRNSGGISVTVSGGAGQRKMDALRRLIRLNLVEKIAVDSDADIRRGRISRYVTVSGRITDAGRAAAL